MRIGVIGAASVGWTLATKWAAKGHDVLIANSRGPETLALRIADAGVPLTAASLTDAAACEIVLLAVPWVKVREVLDPGLAWGGHILIDATNIFLSYAPDFKVDDLGGDSGSEIIARLAPGARVVKAFNTLPIAKMFAPLRETGLQRVLFVAGDDTDAVHAVGQLIEDVDLVPVGLGTLAVAGRQMEVGGPLSGRELFAARPKA